MRLIRSISTPPRPSEGRGSVLAAGEGAAAGGAGGSTADLAGAAGAAPVPAAVEAFGDDRGGAAAAPQMNSSRYRSRVLPRDALDPSHPQIKRDILRMIAQYLHNESYYTSVMVLQDEANMKTTEQQSRRVASKRLRKAVLEGDWEVAAGQAKGLPRQHHKRYLYALYRQEYLELIEKQEYQKAFAYLNRRLKPMEATAAANPAEFQGLCYLLTCKSVADCPHFAGWEGVMAGREKLADELARLLEVEGGAAAAAGGGGASIADASAEIPPDRLVALLQQAVAYQMEFRRYHPRMVPTVTTLARDYQCPVVPNTQRDLFVGHASSVKAVEWCGEEGFLLAAGAGGGDFGICIWGANPGVLGGSAADLDDFGAYDAAASAAAAVEAGTAAGGGSSRRGSWQLPASAYPDARIRTSMSSFRSSNHGSGGGGGGGMQNGTAGGSEDGRLGAGSDAGGTVTFEQLRCAADCTGSDMGYGRTSKPLLWLRGHTNKVWDLASNKDGSRLASASGDGTVRLWALPGNAALSAGTAPDPGADTPAIGSAVATLTGHHSDVYSVAFHPDQFHVVTGGHDRTVRLFDVRAAKEVKAFAGHEAGVLQATTNAHGNLLVSGSRDGTVRFWDVLSGVCVRTLTQPLGAVTSVQVSRDGLYLLTSSRHASVRLWDMRMGSDERPLVRYRGHQNTSSSFLRASFAAEETLIVGGSDCGALHVWDRKNGDLLQRLRGHSGAVYRGAWCERQSMVATCGEDSTVRTWWWREEVDDLFNDVTGGIEYTADETATTTAPPFDGDDAVSGGGGGGVPQHAVQEQEVILPSDLLSQASTPPPAPAPSQAAAAATGAGGGS